MKIFLRTRQFFSSNTLSFLYKETQNSNRITLLTRNMASYASAHTVNKRISPIGEIAKPEVFITKWMNFRNAHHDLEQPLLKEFQQGVNLRQEGKHTEAIKYFDSIINLFSGENLGELTGKQRNLLSRAHFNKADIIRVGTASSEKQALSHLQCALELDPDYTAAKELIEAIELDNEIPNTFSI